MLEIKIHSRVMRTPAKYGDRHETRKNGDFLSRELLLSLPTRHLSKWLNLVLENAR